MGKGEGGEERGGGRRMRKGGREEKRGGGGREEGSTMLLLSTVVLILSYYFYIASFGVPVQKRRRDCTSEVSKATETCESNCNNSSLILLSHTYTCYIHGKIWYKPTIKV